MSESIVALELAEIDALADLYRAAGAGVVTDCGLSATEIGDAVLVAARSTVFRGRSGTAWAAFPNVILKGEPVGWRRGST